MKKLYVAVAFALIFALAIIITPMYSARAEETFIWEGSVSSNGDPTNSPALEAGVQYRVVAKTVFWYGAGAADAQYYTTSLANNWIWENHFPAPDGHSFLQINEMDIDWGPFSNGQIIDGNYYGHVYETYYTGTGASIIFRIVDWMDGDYSNNACHFVIEIYKMPRFYGCTPGFWKNHPEAWPAAYDPSDMLKSVFGSSAPDVTLMQALQGGGGSGINGAKKILARAAVAALLNAETFGSSYPYTVSQLIDMVSYQFSNGNRGSMLSLAAELDYWNNMGCPPCWS